LLLSFNNKPLNLVLDIGNSLLKAGIFKNNNLINSLLEKSLKYLKSGEAE